MKHIPQWLKRRRFFLFFILLNLLVFSASSQVTIHGRVSGPESNGLPGITVSIRNTVFATATDQQGDYSLTANLKKGTYTLVFTGIGFRNEAASLVVDNKQQYAINAQLAADALGLDEVIVTGTSQGTTRRQIGSYISSVSADQLNKGATGNVLAALQGKTAGAQITQNSGDPSGGISVRLRGISTIYGSSEPLYIVDGIIVNNGTNRVTNTTSNYDGANFIGTVGQNRMTDINPADIERIEVLNGAAAAAIYGSRANAGVVQIFTKRGSSGAPVVSFSTSLLVNQVRKKLPVNNAPVKFGGSPDVFTQDILSPAITNTTPVTRYDYQDYIFHTGVGTDNNVSVSGGKDKTKYYVSGSYFFNQGIIKNTDFRRYSFRANVDQELTDWASFSIGLNYINSSANEKPDGNSFFSPMNSITIIGNFHDIFARDALGNLLSVGERGRVSPVSVIEDIKQQQETNRVLVSAGLKLKPVKNLTVDYRLGIDNYAQNGNTFIPPFAYNVSTGFYGGGASLDPTLNGYASTASNTFFQINNELNATYQANISKNLGSTTQLGYSVQYEKNRYILFQGRGLAPFVETVNGASSILPGADNRTEIAISGGYIQQNFKYKDQLFITGAVRLDGSSVFGVDQRNQAYIKASGSYIISSASYWEKLGIGKWFDLLKLRAAYGESGNLTGIGAYARTNTYSSVSYLGRTSLYSLSTRANENVSPERQKELEIGADLSLFDNRAGLQFNWYSKKVEDLLIDRQIASTTGFSSLLDNYGALQNKGFEIVLNVTPVRKPSFSWEATVIFNRNRNKAVRTGLLTLFNTNGGAPVAIIIDQPVGVFYGTFFARDEGNNEVKNTAGIPMGERGTQNGLEYTVVRDANGLPSQLPEYTNLRKIIGDPNPDYTASLVNELNYRKFGLRIQLDAVQGVDVFNADFRTRQGVGNGKVAEMEHNGTLPRGYISGVYAVEEWRIDDGSFVKLREISLNFNAGKIIRGINDLSFSLSGRNLFSWDNYDGYDPEVNAAGQSTILRGIGFGSIPVPRTFSVGIQAKF